MNYLVYLNFSRQDKDNSTFGILSWQNAYPINSSGSFNMQDALSTMIQKDK